MTSVVTITFAAPSQKQSTRTQNIASYTNKAEQLREKKKNTCYEGKVERLPLKPVIAGLEL